MTNVVSKFEVAKTLLLKSIVLYFEGEFVCSLPLSGASEELCGSLVKYHGGETALEKRIKVLEVIQKESGRSDVSERSNASNINHMKNSLKHLNMSTPGNAIINLGGIKKDSKAMIFRAIDNYVLLVNEFNYPPIEELDRMIGSFRSAS